MSVDRTAKPNIVLMVADDLGYGDLGCYGCKDIATPNIDSIAARGVRLTQFHVAIPVCAPMRVSMLTGKYPHRTSLAWNPNWEDPEDGLSTDEFLISEALKSAGYVTGLFGKWHMGYAPKFRPSRQGFDTNYGPISGWAHYFEHTYREHSNWMFRDDEPFDEPGYLTDLFTREALSFIDRHAREPFFCFIPYTAPHGPWLAPDGREGETRDVYVDIVENLDHNVGLILRRLDERGLADNTLVIFLSDNGADPPPLPGSNGNLRGGKREVYEGGIRTPFVARWPSAIPAGTVVDTPVISMDIYNTLAAAAGAALPEGAAIDGDDVIELLAGRSAGPDRDLFFNFGAGFAVRSGKWKLVELDGESVGLYDIAADPTESNNLLESDPAVVRDLEGRLAGWKTDVVRGVRVYG